MTRMIITTITTADANNTRTQNVDNRDRSLVSMHKNRSISHSNLDVHSI